MSNNGISNLNSNNNNDGYNLARLTTELCSMTGCNEELALMQLINCDYDLQLAANKIFEYLPTNDEVNDGWQIINRQKKIKKKETKSDVGVNGNSVKKNGFNRNSKPANTTSGNLKLENFKNDDQQNYTRLRNKNHRYKRPKDNEESGNYYDKFTIDSDLGFVLNEDELRWDNIGDIEGEFKESGTNSAVDCFYSDEDLEFPIQPNDDSYQGIGLQLTSKIDNTFKINTSKENYSKQSEIPTKSTNNSHSSDSKFLSECLAQQLPIFGKFCKTEPPKSLPIIPSKPVSFASTIKSRNKNSKPHYYFGINISELLNTSSSNELKLPFSSKSIPVIKQSGNENSFNFNLAENTLVSPNNSNYNNILMQTGMPDKNKLEGILHSVYKQQQEVAILFGQHPTQSYYRFSNPVNLIPMSNPKPMGPLYPMPMHSESLAHPNQECILQNSFPTSISMPVPFQMTRK